MDEENDGGPQFDLAHAMRGYTAVMLTVAVTALGWLALQFVDVRDTVHRLDATIPVQINALDYRVRLLEDKPVVRTSQIHMP